MTKTIEAALAERELLDTDFKALVKILRDDMFIMPGHNEPAPLTELERKRILIRMGAIKQSLKWLDNLLVGELISKPHLITVPQSVSKHE